jgi:hypothetical protein
MLSLFSFYMVEHVHFVCRVCCDWSFQLTASPCVLLVDPCTLFAPTFLTSGSGLSCTQLTFVASEVAISGRDATPCERLLILGIKLQKLLHVYLILTMIVKCMFCHAHVIKMYNYHGRVPSCTHPG